MTISIYESPDGGNTIYQRQAGSVERQLIKGNFTGSVRLTYADLVYANILAEQNPALQEALDKFILLYNLVKDHGQTKYSK